MARPDHDRLFRPTWMASRPAPRAVARTVLPALLIPPTEPPRSGNDNRRGIVDDGPADELSCLRGVLAPALLRAAAVRSRELGLGADQILITQGVIGERAYLRHLSAHLGVEIDPLIDLTRGDCAIRDEQFPVAARSGMLQVQRDGELLVVVAPRCLGARLLTRAIKADPALAGRYRLATTADLDRLIIRLGGPALAHLAAHGLRDSSPAHSAAPPIIGARWRYDAKRAMRIGSVAALIVVPPLFAGTLWTSVLTVAFLVFVLFRLAACLVPRRSPGRLSRQNDAELPVYTVIAALYREASSVAPLMRALDALDYPREKLDVILVTEPDDLQTRAAIARLGPMPHVQLLVAPAIAPQTKPKALNYALCFARGSFTAIFDAEDRPMPGQLRAALDAFRRHDASVACAQASLCIDNTSEGLLAAMFTAEYAGQFDLFLPGLAKLRLPLPLGGSSNHFRTDVLRRVGGWDAYNVTEDADLGFRLARFGYRSVTFASTTFEEAPVHFGVWLRQRSRWMKGWMQTWSVHMRNPRRLWREAGPQGFLTINLLVGGTVLTALAYPTLAGGLLKALLFPRFAYLTDTMATLHLAVIVTGLLSTVGIGLLGLAARGQLRHGWVLLLAPLYWGLLSIAAWRALWQLLWDPYHWEKTDHGLSRRPRIRLPHHR